MQERKDEELDAGSVARELGRSRQWAWFLLSNGRIPHARQICGRWWVAPKNAVLAFKESQAA